MDGHVGGVGFEDVSSDARSSLTSVESCQLQLAELEMMESMFPGDVVVVDESALAERHSVIDGATDRTQSPLQLTLKITANQREVRVDVSLPSLYPAVEPYVLLRGDFTGCRDINKDLRSFIETREPDQLYIGSVIGWIQDHAELYQVPLESSSDHGSTACSSSAGDRCDALRLWIVSHHIYSRIKRRNMLGLARDLHLQGFSLIGKPGVVCVEGSVEHVNAWWKQVKSWTWKRISVRKEESFRMIADWGGCLFGPYSELELGGTDRMSRFAEFLSEHGCAAVLGELLGF